MTAFRAIENLSSVTAMLPQSTAGRVVEEVFNRGGHGATIFNARGTLLRDHWIQRLIPVMSPVMRYVQVLVPDDEVDGLIEEIYAVGGLHRPGAGAVFTIPCEEVIYSTDYPVWSPSSSSGSNASLNIKENLTAIYCITGRDEIEAISRAAVQAGGHGPVVQLCQGRGLRAGLGWLRITSKANKEVLAVVVDNTDADNVFDAIIRAGRIGSPGRGIAYRIPVQKGVVNLTSVYGHAHQAATLEQIVTAIDEIKGDSHWRDQSVIDLGRTGKVAGVGLAPKGPVDLRDYVSLICVVPREHMDALMEAAIQAGAPGINVVYGKFSETEKSTAAGVSLTRERGVLRTILPRARLDGVRRGIVDTAELSELPEICLYIQSVSRVVTYLPEVRKPLTGVRYRGSFVASD
ncbi:MAG: hypothetical protein J4A00_06365 [Gammaproteobacteria bacterium]|nr:hypothetical protein [Gammaproteobacteria bacterium]